MTITQAAEKLDRLADNIETVIFGKRQVIRSVLTALICHEHVLIEDVPGVGKTRLISSLAKSLNASFSRIQFTPDIMPSDVTGITVYNPGTKQFSFRPGAVFAQIVMADELNRTPPRTQSSLLEIMEERQTTVDGQTHKLPVPFMVLASQNPLLFEGTYPLPEAQLDRFLMSVNIGYPDKGTEAAIIQQYGVEDPFEKLESVITTEDIQDIQQLVPKIKFKNELNMYIASLMEETRKHPQIRLGISPRGGIALAKAARGRALLNGRDYVVPDDVKELVYPVFSHRLVLMRTLQQEENSIENILKSVCETVPVPVF